MRTTRIYYNVYSYAFSTRCVCSNFVQILVVIDHIIYRVKTNKSSLDRPCAIFAGRPFLSVDSGILWDSLFFCY